MRRQLLAYSRHSEYRNHLTKTDVWAVMAFLFVMQNLSDNDPRRSEVDISVLVIDGGQYLFYLNIAIVAASFAILDTKGFPDKNVL
jgi:hypothetical protein